MNGNNDKDDEQKPSTSPKRTSVSPRGPPPPVQPRSPRGQAAAPEMKSEETQSEAKPRRSLRPAPQEHRVKLAPREATTLIEATISTASLPMAEEGTKKPSDKLSKLFKRERPSERVSETDSEHLERPRGRSTLDRRENMRSKASRILYTTDEEVRDALMEFGVFIIFLILTSLVTLSVRHSYMFYFNDTMKKLFTTRELVVAPSLTISFEKLITVPDFWDYMIYNFLVTLHGDMTIINSDGSQIEDHDEDEDYHTTTAKPTQPVNRADPADPANPANPDSPEDPPEGVFKRRKKRQVGADATDTDTDHSHHGNMTHLEGRVFLHENLLLGPPRLRQIRVRKDSCYVNDAFIRYFNTCYAAYSAGAEEIVNEHGGAPYKTMGQLDSTPLWTTLGFYRSGGYTIDLTFNKKKNLQTIKELKKQHWLDRGSRLCLVEFNLYNENTDIFQSAKFIAEIPPTGGVIPQSHLQTVKQFSFITDKNLGMSVVYIFWYIMVVYYNIYEINAIRKCGFKNYFKSILNVLDSLILIFCYLALVYNIWHTFKVKALVSRAKFEETYQSLDSLCFWNTIYVDMMAILAFLVWIKIFKFISFNKTLVQFTTTLKRCSKDLAGFSLMFGIVFLAYAQLGLLLFGTKHPDFRNFVTSILTMIRMILGDFQYNLIEESNRVLGPIYFLTYILLVFFILLNMFLAIIMETYNSVKSEITQGRSQLGAYIYKKLSKFIHFITHCGRKRQNQPAQQRRLDEDEDDDGAPDDMSPNRYQPPKVQLRRNMTEAEAHYFEDVPHDVSNKDMFRLNNRVSLLEEILEQLVTNMDGILKRVENEIKKNK